MESGKARNARWKESQGGEGEGRKSLERKGGRKGMAGREKSKRKRNEGDRKGKERKERKEEEKRRKVGKAE